MAIDARTRALLDKYYSHAIEGVTSDQDELLIAEDMLRRARSGAVPDETGAKTIVIDPRRKMPLDNPLLVKSAVGALRQENVKRVLPIAGIVGAMVMLVFLMNREKETRKKRWPPTPPMPSQARSSPERSP